MYITFVFFILASTSPNYFKLQKYYFFCKHASFSRMRMYFLSDFYILQQFLGVKFAQTKYISYLCMFIVYIAEKYIKLTK